MNCWLCGRFMQKWRHEDDPDYSFFTCEHCSVQSSLPGTYRYMAKASHCQANLDEAVQYIFSTSTFEIVPAIDHSRERVMHP